jgi:adenylate cyclase
VVDSQAKRTQQTCSCVRLAQVDENGERDLPSAEELEELELYDPSSPQAADRLTLLYMALSSGVSLEELITAPNIGELVLDRKLRPRLALTVADVVGESELEWAQVEKLLRALGVPADPEAHISEGERVAIRVLIVSASDILGFESTLQLARTAGEAMSRVAEALVTAVRLRVELPHRESGTPYGESVKEYSELARSVLPEFVQMLDAALRRQIIGVAERMWSSDSEGSAIVLPRAIGFADLVGYTATAAKLSARGLTEVLMEFDELTWAIVSEGGGQIVKTIGDEAMFVTEEPVTACRIANNLVDCFGRGTLPPVRVGVAAGDVVSVFGDHYGPDVNLAARLVDAAEPSMVLVSEKVRAQCSSDFLFETLPPLNLRGMATPVAAARLIGNK